MATLHLRHADWQLALRPDGTLAALATAHGDFAFRADQHAGPAWWGRWGAHDRAMPRTPYDADWRGDWQDGQARVALQPCGGTAFAGRLDGLAFRLEYVVRDGWPAVVATLTNEGDQPFAPRVCALKLGLDTAMTHYPAWRTTPFPTLLRCERTHFWGYAMTPAGQVLGWASPDPIAAWSMDWNRASYGDYGHLIPTANLHLLNAPPLPARHPHDCHALAPGASRTWTLVLCPLPSLDAVLPTLAPLCQAPLLHLDRTTLGPGEVSRLTVHATAAPVVTLGGNPVPLAPAGQRVWTAVLTPGDAPGQWPIVATLGGRRSEALLCRRQPYSWYLARGREEALRCPPRASTHLESWLGLFTLLLARRHLPDPALDARGEALWQAVIPAMIDPATGAPRHHRARVPNTGYLISALVDRYEAEGDCAHLELACRLAEAMLAYQGEDGGIYGSAGGERGHVHYTCVCYPAKSLLELLQAVRPLATEPAWAARAARLEAALHAAMDDLVRRGDRIETEGEQTFEDGMIACAAAQLAAWALDRPEGVGRTPYRDTAVAHALSHRCLEQRLIPDCRMRGATLRFWESQYDVRLYPNMFNSPHGWTSWTTYATWYLYLLTGEVAWLRQTMNALGACLQCVDTASGRLRWAFVPDPWVEYQQFGPAPDRRLDGSGGRIFFPDPDRPASGEPRRGILGEQYVEMIGDRYPFWCCDNDVHEHFKCLAEVALTSAYIAETAPGVYETWNCRLAGPAAGLAVTPAEPLVTALHLNLRQPAQVRVHFAAGETVAAMGAGLHWLRAHG